MPVMPLGSTSDSYTLPHLPDHEANSIPQATNHSWGNVASVRDAATRGSQNSPLTEAMPASPTNLDPDFKY